MARLKENQEAIDRGDWAALPDAQRQDLENTFRHTGQTARYTNIMGIKTVCFFVSFRQIEIFSFLVNNSRHDHQ